MADKLLNHRRDKYTSYMYLSEDGTMFLTKSFERVITTSEKRRVKNKHVDYKNRILTVIKWVDDGEKESEAVAFPDGGTIPVDPIAAFYNFRAGAYGELKPPGRVPDTGPAEEGRRRAGDIL